jgi:hypothetical protein
VTSVLDVWRAVDPAATFASGADDRLGHPVRGLIRTRAAAPHLPATADGELLLADAAVVPDGRLDSLVDALRDAGLRPAAAWIAGSTGAFERAGAELLVLASAQPLPALFASVQAYLDAEGDALGAVAAEIRLAGAEAALADPQPAAPAGVVAARLRRGVAVSVAGTLRALTPRPAGRSLATRFAAAHARLLGDRTVRPEAARRTRDGLWVVGRDVGDAATAWLFDDLPFARVDEVALDALAVTLRALLRRHPEASAAAERPRRLPPSTGDPLRDTLLAVARANGRIAPAARALGVHRNTVLYRLRRASFELGVDPRRPDDALRLLQDDPRR